MAFTWTFDAPDGVYKSHAMSKKLYRQAVMDSHFMEHVRPVQGYGKKRGESVTITRVANIVEPDDGKIAEQARIPEDVFALSTIAVTVSEYGRAVPFTSLSKDLSEFDIEGEVQGKLLEQQRLVLDTAAAAAFKTAKTKYIPTGVSAKVLDLDGTASTQAAANMNVFHVEEIRDYLYDTLHAPFADGDSYIGIFRSLGLRGLKRDPAWEQWHTYTDPEAKASSEVGRVETLRFIETNHAQALGKVGAQSVLGEGVVFGRDAVVMAEAQAPELRAEMNRGHDFGRSRAVAWYAILAFLLVWDTANAGEAKVLHVTSS
jgi:N4-gp56 family major capsid protein